MTTEHCDLLRVSEYLSSSYIASHTWLNWVSIISSYYIFTKTFSNGSPSSNLNSSISFFVLPNCLQKIFIIPILIHFRGGGRGGRGGRGEGGVMEYKLWKIFQSATIKSCTLQIILKKTFNYSDI